jgi:hypothetical protein
VEPKADVVTPEQIRDETLRTSTTPERIRELYTEAKKAGYDDVTLVNESGDDELLMDLLIRVGKERAPSLASVPASANGKAA